MPAGIVFKKLPLSAAVAMAMLGGAALAQEAPQMIEEVEVIGFKSSLEKALERKRNASGVVDGIAAEDIGKFPDQNVAEALQRITGVSISRTNGEGSQVTVRGFGPEFNQVRVNGRLIASTTSGRDFDFQMMPSDLIAGADIVKTPTANMQEGSIGAAVNLRTARPLDKPGFQGAAAAKMRHNDLADEYDPELSAIFSNTFADDTVGLSIGFAFTESTNRIDMAGGVRSSVFDGRNGDVNGDPIQDLQGNPTTVTDLRFPGRQEFRIEQEARERLGINAVLQWQPAEHITNSLDMFYSDFSRQGQGFGIQAPLQSGAFSGVVASPNNTVMAGTTTPQRFDILQIDQGSDSETYLLGWQTALEFDDYSLTADFSHSRAEDTENRSDLVPQIGSGNGTDDLGTISFDGRNSDVLGVTTTIDVADPRNVRAHWNNLQRDEIESEVTELKLSGLKMLDLGVLDSVEVGTAYSKLERGLDHFETDGNLNCQATCGSGLAMSPELFSVIPFDDYLSEESGNFPRQFVYISDLPGYMQELNALKDGDAFNPVYSPRASSKVEEETTNIFVQFNFEDGEIAGMPWSANIGFRYAETDVTSSGADQLITAVRRNDPNNPNATALLVDFSDTTNITVENSYNNFLPSANFRLDMTDDVVLRLAAAKVITRPTIDALGVAQSYVTSNIESFGLTSGNPQLTPFEVSQFDASLEYYLENGSSYSIAFYSKHIETFISETTIVEDSGLDLSSNFGADIDLMQARTAQQNRTGGSIEGFELAATHYFDYLPGWADGFGVQANYTYADSEDDNVELNELPAVTQPSFGVEGFAKNAYNIVGFYDKNSFQARLAYNWRDEFLLSRRGARSFGLPEIVDAYGQFDLSASYDVSDTLTITFESINLTNERAFITEDVPERVSLVSYSGRRFTLGARLSF